MKAGDKTKLAAPAMFMGDMERPEREVPTGTPVTLVSQDVNYECLWEVVTATGERFMANGAQLGVP